MLYTLNGSSLQSKTGAHRVKSVHLAEIKKIHINYLGFSNYRCIVHTDTTQLEITGTTRRSYKFVEFIKNLHERIQPFREKIQRLHQTKKQ